MIAPPVMVKNGCAKQRNTKLGKSNEYLESGRKGLVCRYLGRHCRASPGLARAAGSNPEGPLVATWGIHSEPRHGTGTIGFTWRRTTSSFSQINSVSSWSPATCGDRLPRQADRAIDRAIRQVASPA